MTMKRNYVQIAVMTELAAGGFDHIDATDSNVPRGRVASEFVSVRAHNGQPGPICKVMVDCRDATKASITKATAAALAEWHKAVKKAG
jgi:hypothetical protein